MKMRDFIERMMSGDVNEENLLTKTYTRKEAMDAAMTMGTSNMSYPHDKWGNPKNKHLKKWFDKFREEEDERRERQSMKRRELPYFT